MPSREKLALIYLKALALALLPNSISNRITINVRVKDNVSIRIRAKARIRAKNTARRRTVR